MKKSLLFLSSLLLFFCLLIFPARTFFYACEGVNLWFHTILPSLLPFLILTSLLLGETFRLEHGVAAAEGHVGKVVCQDLR